MMEKMIEVIERAQHVYITQRRELTSSCKPARANHERYRGNDNGGSQNAGNWQELLTRGTKRKNFRTTKFFTISCYSCDVTKYDW